MLDFFKRKKAEIVINPNFEKLIDKSLQQIKILSDDLNPHVQFEGLIYCHLFITANKGDEFRENYMNYIISVRQRFDVKMSTKSCKSFFRNRSNFYIDELENMRNEHNYTANKIYYIFNVEQLTYGPEHYYGNILSVITFKGSFAMLTNSLKNI